MWTGKSRDITIKEIGFCNSRNELFQMFTELDRASQPRKVHVKIPKLRLHHTRSRNRNQTRSQASLIRPEPNWSNLLRTWLNSDVKSEHTDRQRQHQSSAPKKVKRRALISIRIGITWESKRRWSLPRYQIEQPRVPANKRPRYARPAAPPPPPVRRRHKRSRGGEREREMEIDFRFKRMIKNAKGKAVLFVLLFG